MTRGSAAWPPTSGRAVDDCAVGASRRWPLAPRSATIEDLREEFRPRLHLPTLRCGCRHTIVKTCSAPHGASAHCQAPCRVAHRVVATASRMAARQGTIRSCFEMPFATLAPELPSSRPGASGTIRSRRCNRHARQRNSHRCYEGEDLLRDANLWHLVHKRAGTSRIRTRRRSPTCSADRRSTQAPDVAEDVVIRLEARHPSVGDAMLWVLSRCVGRSTPSVSDVVGRIDLVKTAWWGEVGGGTNVPGGTLSIRAFGAREDSSSLDRKDARGPRTYRPPRRRPRVRGPAGGRRSASRMTLSST